MLENHKVNGRLFHQRSSNMSTKQTNFTCMHACFVDIFL